MVMAVREGFDVVSVRKSLKSVPIDMDCYAKIGAGEPQSWRLASLSDHLQRLQPAGTINPVWPPKPSRCAPARREGDEGTP